MANKDETETLLSAMDEAAESLISLVKDVDITLPPLERPSVSEKIKMFEALTDYMKYREKPQGSAPANSKLKNMQQRFNGNNGGDHKTKGRGGRGGTAAEGDDSSSGTPN